VQIPKAQKDTDGLTIFLQLWDQVSISSTFYASLLSQYFCAQKITKPKCNKRKAAQSNFVQKFVRKMLMKLTPGRIKAARKTLLKLTPPVVYVALVYAAL